MALRRAQGQQKINRLTRFTRKPINFLLAEGPGFEPGLTGPEPVVLPLDDPSVNIIVTDILKHSTSQVKCSVWFIRLVKTYLKNASNAQ